MNESYVNVMLDQTGKIWDKKIKKNTKNVESAAAPPPTPPSRFYLIPESDLFV